MDDWEGKTRGGLTGYRIFIFTLRRLGLYPAYFLLVFVSFYYFLFARKSNKYIYYLYRKRLHYRSLRARWAVYRNYYIFGQVLIDKVAAMAGMGDRFSYDFDGEEYLRGMQNGGLLISAHIGNWEVAGNLLKRLNKPFNIVMFDQEHEKIKDYLDKVMKEKNIKVIVIKNDLSHLIQIRDALKNHELIAIHGDRFLEGAKTLTMDFLGQPAKFPEGPFYLALRFGVPVSYVFAMKDKLTHYHFYATPARSYENKGKRNVREEDVRSMLSDYLLEFEDKLLRYPEQWFNYYKFWDD
jgi:predicted LPLAT superfamily acyltransferase